MSKWVHSDVLDLGINKVKTDCNAMLLIKAYTAGDSYATVNGNKLASVAMTSSDFTLGSSGSNRTLTPASGKSANATANSGASPDLHIAFVDTTNSKVLWVTDETSDQVITSGNPINFPAPVYTTNQPT
jgi:streptogramin lyase